MVFKQMFQFLNDPFKNSIQTKEEEITNPNSSTNHFYFHQKGEVNEMKKMFKKIENEQELYDVL